MTAPLEIRRRYPDPIEDVWAAFTESERLARWFGTYTGVGRPGGTVELIMTGEVDAGGEVSAPFPVTVHECVAPRRLVVEMPEGDASWHITVELAPDGAGTVVVFAQQMLPGVDAGDVEAGWRWYLDRLGASLSGAAMPDWAAYSG